MFLLSLIEFLVHKSLESARFRSGLKTARNHVIRAAPSLGLKRQNATLESKILKIYKLEITLLTFKIKPNQLKAVLVNSV